ncbi:MAG: TatD family hydrolase [bacterium]|nr:TatD family hydrolase [bacterium]
MFFDSHTHVNFGAFEEDRESVIKRAFDNETWMINVGTQLDTSKSAVELALKHDGVFAAIGLHPIHTWQQMVDEEESHFKSHQEQFEENEYEKLLNDKVVAVGETGLDYFRLPETNQKTVIRKQKTAFIAQMNFAKKHKLPLVVHCRSLLDRQAGAYDDVLEVLKAEYLGLPGVIHSFTDTWETAKKFLDFGFYVALNGILTFDKTGKLAEVVKNAPADRLLIETDAPYLTPPPYRGKRNEPFYVKHVAEKIAEIKGESLEKIAEQTFNNAVKLFKIPPLE